MNHYTITLAGLERKLPICKIHDDLAIGAFVLFGDAPLTQACAAELLQKISCEYDYFLTAEAKGIPLIHEMARQSKAEHYFVARKFPKLYMTGVFEVDVRSITTDADQKLYLDIADADLMKGKRILLVDDVVSTGKSMAALAELVRVAGGVVCGKMTVLAEGDAQNDPDLIYLEKLPLFRPDGSILA